MSQVRIAGMTSPQEGSLTSSARRQAGAGLAVADGEANSGVSIGRRNTDGKVS
jgi:hypothetical protein